MSTFRRLLENGDRENREELKDFFIVSKSRIDNLITCLEEGAKTISELTNIIAKQQEEIAKLNTELLQVEKETEK